MIYRLAHWLRKENDCFYSSEEKAIKARLLKKHSNDWSIEAIELDEYLPKEFTKQVLAWREVGTAQEMPGTNGGFSMFVFNGKEVPVGTKVYVVTWEGEK